MYNVVQRADRVPSIVTRRAEHRMSGSHGGSGAGHRTWVDDVAETGEEKIG